jgi:hypothetical protein
MESGRCEEECMAESCWSLAGGWGVEECDCPGVELGNEFDSHPATQQGCAVEFSGPPRELLGARACFDERVIVTSRGCLGMGLPTSMVRFRFECPVGDNEQEVCFVTLALWD